LLFELRQYWCKPGKRDEWAAYMDGTVMPYQVSKGMVVVATFIDEEDPDHYVWIRRFEDEADRERLYKAVYETDAWTNDMMPRVTEMLDRERAIINRLIPTPKSVIS
jgi:quinol monooxygenase YgiN